MRMFLQSSTSLGSVESIIEQRAVSDESEDPRLVRISVGLEDIEVGEIIPRSFPFFLYPYWNYTDEGCAVVLHHLQDLKDDLRRAFRIVALTVRKLNLRSLGVLLAFVLTSVLGLGLRC